MKKNLLWAALAAMLAVGCQETEVTNGVPKAKAITFSTEVGKGTKAPISGTTYPTDVPFGVFAYALTDNSNWTTSSPLTNKVMDDVKITHQTDTWKAETGSYYWPNNADTKLSFFAYSPKTVAATFTTAADGITFTDYVNDGETDLMYASKTDLQSGQVALSFSHAMTQVLFTAKRAATYAGINIKIKSIKLNQIASQGTFKAQTATWSSVGTPVDTYEIYNDVTGQSVTETKTQVGSALVMIPQTSKDLTFTVIYEISGTGVAKETVTKIIAFGNDWERNQKISYNLNIALNEITFNPTVTDWTTTTDKPIDVQ